MTKQKVTIGNVCLISDPSNKKVLLLKRNRDPMKDMYTGEGGKTHFEEDIRFSCLREVKEETGLNISELKLKAVIKTVLDETKESSWILFVYVAKALEEKFMECDEGTLQWIDKSDVGSYNLVGFIRETLPYIFKDDYFLEGTKSFMICKGTLFRRNYRLLV